MPKATATLEPTSTAPAENFEDQGAPRFIDVENLMPNPWNRGRGLEEDLVKLAESIKSKGYLNPILVRMHPKKEGKFEIVAGEQRYHAGLLLGRAAIPAFVRESMPDAEVMEVMEIENLRRVAPSPMQQAELIRKYREKGYDTRNLAAVLGEAVHIIRRREKLLDLSPRWKKELASKESPVTLWGVEHLELIARYSPKMQDEIFDDIRHDDPGEMTPAALEERLREMTKALRLFPWKLEDETLIPKAGSCHACPKRTGALQDLFGEVSDKAGNEDACMDGGCAAKKMTAFLERTVSELKKAHGDCVKLSDSKSYGYKNSDGSLGTDEYSLLQKQREGAVPGVFVKGEKKGTWAWVSVGANKGSKGSKSSGTGAAAAPTTTLKELKERREKRLRCHVLKQLIDHCESKDLVWVEKERPMLLGIAFVFGYTPIRYPANPTWEKVYAAAKKAPSVAELWARMRSVVTDQLHGDMNSQTPDLKEAKEIASVTGFDLAAARVKAEEEIPVPASWATRAEAEKESAKNGKGKKKPAKKPKASAIDEDDIDDEGLDGDSEGDL